MTFSQKLRLFPARQDGGVAIVFGLALVTLLLFAGIAIDYARAYSVELELQSDLDAAILRAASELNDPSEIQDAASKFFGANWKAKHSVSNVSLRVRKSGDNKVLGIATVTVPTTLMKLGGFDTIDLSAVSEVEIAGGNVELAMVLDTTASMAGSKLDALKNAAKSLVDVAYEAPDADEHVKVSIVPFGQYVNVGLPHRHASWMSVPNDSSTPKSWCGMDEHIVTGTSNCRMETVNTTQDGVPYSYQTEVCDHTYAPPTYMCYNWTETQTWNGCAGSRDSPLDKTDDQYSTKVPGIMNAVCGSPITPLTNDKPAIKQQIEALTAAGDTYIPSGLMWGWTVLSSAEPFTEAVSYGHKVDGKPVHKVMVLMTDGFNTLSPVYPEHTGGDRTQSNALTAELCANVKAKDIDIYTVAFDVSDNAVKSILEACASGGGKFFEADDEEELTAAFRNIAKDFSPLRLAR
jgi:Flp pilus assembly protein TadG